MKRKIITFTSFLIFISGYSQTTKTKKIVETELKTIEYSNGREVFTICKNCDEIKFNEKSIYYWYSEFSKIKGTTGSSGGDLLNGKYQFFDEKGNLKTEKNYSFGLQDGNEKNWNIEGEIEDVYKYEKGKIIYSKFKSKDKQNFIEWTGPYLEEGSVKKTYTLYGILIQTEQYLKHLKYKVTSYYLNDKIEQVYTTDPVDRMYDEYIKYYPNGKIELYGKFEEEWRNGEWKWYNEDGTIQSIEKYKITINYSADKKIISKGGEYFDNYENIWLKNGNWYWYKENGIDIGDMKEFKYGKELEYPEKTD